MGIRFYCPQGHKLNVKSYLAGKIGICPHCDARVQIPLTSTRPSSKALQGKSKEENAALPMASPLEDLDEIFPAEVAEPIDAEGSATSLGKPPVKAAVQSPAPFPQSAPAIGSTAPLAASDDPLTESPTAQWWVCPEIGGQQYGPAKAELMRQWMGEGRVLSHHLVWREGWPEWQRAGDCFAHLDQQTKQD